MNTFFNKNLGMLYDVCQIVTCKTARHETWIGKFVYPGSETEDFQFIENILNCFGNISPKLLLLGYRNKKQGSLLELLFSEYVSENIDSFTNEGFLDYVANENRLKRQLASFYLNVDSIEDALGSISKTSYNADIKTYLYEFFIFPSKYAALVKSELASLIRDTERYYHDHSEVAQNCQKSYNYDTVCALLPDNTNIELDYVYSFSIITKYAVAYGASNNQNWIIVGTEYSKVANNANAMQVDIAGFGNAFGDKLRVKIFELINENGEMTLADLSKQLNVVNTIAIYHIDILKKENLLLQRQLGRKVLYSLNIAQISKGLTQLKDLCNGNYKTE